MLSLLEEKSSSKDVFMDDFEPLILLISDWNNYLIQKLDQDNFFNLDYDLLKIKFSHMRFFDLGYLGSMYQLLIQKTVLIWSICHLDDSKF